MSNSTKHHGNLGHSKTCNGRFSSKEDAEKHVESKLKTGKWEKGSVSFDKTPNTSLPWIGNVSRSSKFCAN